MEKVEKEEFVERIARTSVKSEKITRQAKKIANFRSKLVELPDNKYIEFNDMAEVFIGESKNKIRMIFEFDKKITQ